MNKETREKVKALEKELKGIQDQIQVNRKALQVVQDAEQKLYDDMDNQDTDEAVAASNNVDFLQNADEELDAADNGIDEALGHLRDLEGGE